MAAAEYYTGSRPPTSTQTYLAPSPPQPQRASSNPSIPTGQFQSQYSQSPPYSSPQHRPSQPQYPTPPPYSDERKPSVHFAPTPAPQMEQRNSFSHQQRPSFSNHQRPDPSSYPPLPPYNPRDYGPYTPPQQRYPYQQPIHLAPLPTRPYINHNYSESALSNGYSSDPEPHRRRHKHKPERKRRTSDHSRSTNADGFIGAAGGGLIGDLIFPGLGTVGGALAGWLGGKDYGKHRKYREEKRDRAEEDWQRRYGTRDRSHSSDRRSSGHERRRSDY